MKKFQHSISFILTLGAVVTVFGSAVAFAQEGGRATQMMVGVPGLDPAGSDRTLPEYLNALYILLIALGGIFGVIKISIAGVKYALSDIITDKGKAKEDIKGVLLGLLILTLPYLVLSAINRDLVSLDVLNLEPLDTSTQAPISGSFNSGDREQIRALPNLCGTYSNNTRPSRYTEFTRWCTSVGGYYAPPRNSNGGISIEFIECRAPATVACPNWPG